MGMDEVRLVMGVEDNRLEVLKWFVVIAIASAWLIHQVYIGLWWFAWMPIMGAYVMLSFLRGMLKRTAHVACRVDAHRLSLKGWGVNGTWSWLDIDTIRQSGGDAVLLQMKEGRVIRLTQPPSSSDGASKHEAMRWVWSLLHTRQRSFGEEVPLPKALEALQDKVRS